VLCGGCASPEFKGFHNQGEIYERRDGTRTVYSEAEQWDSGMPAEFAEFHGRDEINAQPAGTRSVYKGVEFWRNGPPTGKFVVIGVLSDFRPRSIVAGLAFKQDIAKLTKEKGGDGVIIVSVRKRITGDANPPNRTVIKAAEPASSVTGPTRSVMMVFRYTGGK
jgi:hypothetical protein